MEVTELLKEFAKSQGINVKEVDKFLAQFNSPKNLDELLELPESMLEHVSYISWLGEPLKSFIQDEMWCERYMTIDLERVVDTLLDRKYDLARGIVGDDVDFEDIDFENLEIEDAETKEKLDDLLAVEKYIVDSKFGSVVYDW
jgi:hypothetical protein